MWYNTSWIGWSVPPSGCRPGGLAGEGDAKASGSDRSTTGPRGTPPGHNGDGCFDRSRLVRANRRG